MNEQENIFKHLRAGDVMVIDRGFRDCMHELRERGFLIKTPKGTKNNRLSNIDANASRFATKTRYVIEARNCHIKNKWKYLCVTKNYQSKDFQVCAALVNAFCRKMNCDKND